MIKKIFGETEKKTGKGFQRYLYKIIVTNSILILIPISILGVFWFSMMSQQTEKKFQQQKTIQLNEITSGINQRIKTINLEVATEIREKKYSTYTYSGEYHTDLAMLTTRLSSMIQKYSLIDSVYFYDKTTGNIYNSKSGRYAFDAFYDTKWINEIDDDIYSVQKLPLRYAFDNQELLNKYNKLYCEFNKLVFSLVLKGRPDFYLVANISINKLYNDIADSYNLYDDSLEFFFLNTNGELLEGNCKYTEPEKLMSFLSNVAENEVAHTTYGNRIYFMKALDTGITCVLSYPINESYQESQYLGKYILMICIGLTIFLFIISIYMSVKMYQPINTLYTEVSKNTRNFQKDNIHNDIDLLIQVFTEMNTFNTSATLKLMQFDELSKAFNFRNLLENSQGKNDFMADNAHLFNENGNCFCEMLIIKFDISDMGMNSDEEMLFSLNLQEVLRTYLQSTMKGILTKVEGDNLILLYKEKEGESLVQTRTILTDTVINTTKENAYFAISQPFYTIDDVVPAYHVCRNLITNSYFFDWKNEIITQEYIETSIDNEVINNKLLNMNASFIRNIVSQNELEIEKMFNQLEAELRQIKNATQVKDIYNRIMIELDHEFHFSKLMEIGILQASYENKTLVDMMHYMKKLLNKVGRQYGNNDAKENNYCELAKTYLEQRYMNDMNITDTADHLDISYSYLSKIFRARTGVTLTDYLNNVRIEKSKEYLSNTFLTLTEISEKVGYNNVQSYQRFFKKYVNLTPGDYRKLHQNSADSSSPKYN